MWKGDVGNLGHHMGLRQKTSLKRCQNSERGGLDAKPLKRRTKKSRSATRSISLVTTQPRLDEFLDASSLFEPSLSPDAPISTPTRVESAVSNLGKLESEVIAALFPPSGEAPASMQEISKELGMSVEEVRNIADEALRGLRGLRSGSQRFSKAWN